MVINARRKRILVSGAIAIAIAAGTGVGVALAGGGGNATPLATVSTSAATPGGLNEEFHAALQALVDDGTISQTQANAIREQGDNGSIDPLALVRDGVVNATQMRTVANRLDNVKKDIASRLGDSPASTTRSPGAPKG